ncbi:MAG: histidine phosphatase family protein [Gemmatimonadetes bacterium]|nr:histidine phosphatase family protein [Gemmatimonadota bacterium]
MDPCRTPKPAYFYLARHGLTHANLGRARAARENEPLLPHGREQARILGEKVQPLGVRKIWTSPLDRARETAEIIASVCDLPLEIDAGLREIGSEEWLKSDAEPSREAAEEEAVPSEDMDAATRRVKSTLDRILAEGEPFLAITHLGPIRIARIELAGEDWERFHEIRPDNCTLVEFRRSVSGWEAKET